MASEKTASDEILGKLDTYFEQQAKSASGEERSRWFLTKDLESDLKETITTVDGQVMEAYIIAKAVDEAVSAEYPVARRNELTFLAGILSGLRKRYLAGELSDPVSELDIRRYVMYSSKARRQMIDRLRTYLNGVTE